MIKKIIRRILRSIANNSEVQRSQHMWSEDEDICNIHGNHREFTGYSDFFNQNTYKCEHCDYDSRKRRLLEDRLLGRIKRAEIKKKGPTRGDIAAALKEMYSGDR